MQDAIPVPAEATWSVLGGLVVMLLAIIAFFVRNLITEQRRTREEVTAILVQQAEDNAKFKQVQDSLVALQTSDTALMEKLTDVVERLTRLEEQHRYDRGSNANR